MTRLCVCLLAALALSCKGERTPPLAAGAGIAISDEQFQRVVSIDPDRVPLVDAPCTKDQVLIRNASGAWQCEQVATIDLGRFEAAEEAAGLLSSSVMTVNGRIDTLERRVEFMESRVLAPRFSMTAFSCTVDPTSWDAATPQYHGGRIVNNHMTRIAPVIINCPIYPVRPLARWTRLGVTARDKDGDSGGESAIAVLAGRDSDGTLRTIATVDFSRSRTVDDEYAHLTADISSEVFDFGRTAYHLQVTLDRTTTLGDPSFAGFELFTE